MKSTTTKLYLTLFASLFFFTHAFADQDSDFAAYINILYGSGSTLTMAEVESSVSFFTDELGQNQRDAQITAIFNENGNMASAGLAADLIAYYNGNIGAIPYLTGNPPYGTTFQNNLYTGVLNASANFSVSIPINGGLAFLLIAGIGLGAVQLGRSRKKVTLA